MGAHQEWQRLQGFEGRNGRAAGGRLSMAEGPRVKGGEGSQILRVQGFEKTLNALMLAPFTSLHHPGGRQSLQPPGWWFLAGIPDTHPPTPATNDRQAGWWCFKQARSKTMSEWDKAIADKRGVKAFRRVKGGVWSDLLLCFVHGVGGRRSNQPLSARRIWMGGAGVRPRRSAFDRLPPSMLRNSAHHVGTARLERSEGAGLGLSALR
jgi:hypothetical protein